MSRVFCLESNVIELLSIKVVAVQWQQAVLPSTGGEEVREQSGMLPVRGKQCRAAH